MPIMFGQEHGVTRSTFSTNAKKILSPIKFFKNCWTEFQKCIGYHIDHGPTYKPSAEQKEQPEASFAEQPNSDRYKLGAFQEQLEYMGPVKSTKSTRNSVYVPQHPSKSHAGWRRSLIILFNMDFGMPIRINMRNVKFGVSGDDGRYSPIFVCEYR